MFGIVKKLALVLAISVPMTKTSKKDKINLIKVLYIYYPLQFYKNKKNKL